MGTVLVVLAPGAEEIEAITVADVLVRAQQSVTVASTTGLPLVLGSRGIPLAAHALLDRVRDQDFDLVYLPGGGGSAACCRDDERVQDLAQRQLASGRRLAVICASAIALVPRKLCAGRSLTSYPGVRAQVEPHAGRWLDQPVVIDGNLITSQGPGTALALALALVRLMAGDSCAERIMTEMIATVPAPAP